MIKKWNFKEKQEEKIFLPAIIQSTVIESIRKNEIIETVEAEEIIETVETVEVVENSFNWEVEECPIYDKNGNKIEGFKQIRRNDNFNTLNVCKQSYTPTTNEVLIDTVTKISQLTGFEIVDFKEFKNGNIVIGQLKNEGFNIGDFNFNSYMIVGNSHNYQTSFFIGEHNTMIRCHNQFAAIQQGLKAYHTSTNEQQIKNIIDFYKNYSLLQNATIEILSRLQLAKVTESVKKNLIFNLLEIKPLTNFDELSTRKQNMFTDLENSINNEVKAIGNNAHALFNGVTYWTTHIRQEKEKLYSQFFGSSNNYNQRAMNFLRHEVLN